MEHKDNNITADTIAEQWVRLLLAHIQTNKVVNANENKNQNKEAYERK